MNVNAGIDGRKPVARAVTVPGALAEAGALALLLLLPLLYFWRLVAPNIADRAHLAWGDFGAQYFPLRLFASRELAAGSLPLWNPYVNGGQPALADAQSAVFYLPNLLLMRLAPNGELALGRLELYAVAHFALAGVFTYLLVRYLLRDHSAFIARVAALFSGLTFAYGGYLTSFPVQQLTILEASVWLPLLLLLLTLAANRRSVSFFALAAVPLAFSWTAGHAQTTLYTVYLAAAYVCVRTLGDWRGWASVKLAAGGLMTLLLGTALAAAQLLPTYEFLRLSTRVDLAFRDTSFGLPPTELIGLLLPEVFGGRTLYVGVLALSLAGLAVMLGGRGQPGRFWLAVAVGALLLSLGGNTFLYSAAYLFLPGFNAVRDQERAVILVSFALSVLAGGGLAAFIARSGHDLVQPVRRVRRLLCYFGLSAIVLAIVLLVARPWATGPGTDVLRVGPDRAIFAAFVLLMAAGLFCLQEQRESRPALLAALAIGLLTLDLFTVGWQANLVAAKDAQGYAATTVTESLAGLTRTEAGHDWRISSEGLLPGGGSGASVYRLRDIVGNTPFQLKDFARMSATLDELQRTRLLGVGYWLTKRTLGDGRFKELGAFGDLRLYELASSLRTPRANLLHETRIVPESAALEATSKADLGRVAVLTESPGVEPRPRQVAEEAPRFELDTANRQVVVANLASPGLLVISEVYYPGWRAFVDGVEAPILRAQHLLRAVALPAGEHRVDFRFEPRSLEQGTLISILAGLALIGVTAAAAIRYLKRALPARKSRV